MKKHTNSVIYHIFEYEMILMSMHKISCDKCENLSKEKCKGKSEDLESYKGCPCIANIRVKGIGCYNNTDKTELIKQYARGVVI